MLEITSTSYWVVADIKARALGDWTERVNVRFAYGLNEPFKIFIIVGARRWECDVDVLINGVHLRAGADSVKIWPDGSGEVLLDLQPRSTMIRPRVGIVDAIIHDEVTDVLAIPEIEMLEVAKKVAAVRAGCNIKQPQDGSIPDDIAIDLEAELARILGQPRSDLGEQINY